MTNKQKIELYREIFIVCRLFETGDVCNHSQSETKKCNSVDCPALKRLLEIIK